MDESRRSFLKILPAGAAAVGISMAGPARAEDKKDSPESKEVPLFVCGNCKEWELKDRETIHARSDCAYYGPVRRNAERRIKKYHNSIRERGENGYMVVPWETRGDEILAMEKKIWEEERAKEEARQEKVWDLMYQSTEEKSKTKRKLNGRECIPGTCRYMAKGRTAYSNDPACATFELVDDPKIVWTEDIA